MGKCQASMGATVTRSPQHAPAKKVADVVACGEVSRAESQYSVAGEGAGRRTVRECVPPGSNATHNPGCTALTITAKSPVDSLGGVYKSAASETHAQEVKLNVANDSSARSQQQSSFELLLHCSKHGAGATL